MNLSFMIAGVGAAMIFLASVAAPSHEELSTQQRLEVHQLAQYRAFAFATRLYLLKNPTFSGTLTWATLRESDSTPPAMRNGVVNSTFKAVVVSASDYVICGELPEGVATAINQFMPEDAKSKVASGGQLVFAADQAAANAAAQKCAS